jgi:hypothetical protein
MSLQNRLPFLRNELRRQNLRGLAATLNANQLSQNQLSH